MRTKFLPFHTPEVGDEEISAVVETLRSDIHGSVGPATLHESKAMMAYAEATLPAPPPLPSPVARNGGGDKNSARLCCLIPLSYSLIWGRVREGVPGLYALQARLSWQDG
jgi:hypothetical protein